MLGHKFPLMAESKILIKVRLYQIFPKKLGGRHLAIYKYDGKFNLETQRRAIFWKLWVASYRKRKASKKSSSPSPRPKNGQTLLNLSIADLHEPMILELRVTHWHLFLFVLYRMRNAEHYSINKVDIDSSQWSIIL